jgi:hypothetical protein
MSPKKRTPKKKLRKPVRASKAAVKKSAPKKRLKAKKKPARRGSRVAASLVKAGASPKQAQISPRDTLGEWSDGEEMAVRDSLSEDDDFLEIGGSE